MAAAFRYPLLVLLPILLLGALGGIAATSKKASYTATAQLLVGSPPPGTTGELPGVVQAEQTLTGIYAREIGFDPVVKAIARHFTVSPNAVRSHLSATPLADAPIIKIQATAATASQAMGLANAASSALGRFLVRQTQSSATVNALLRSYQAAASAQAQAQAQLRKDHMRDPDPTVPRTVADDAHLIVAQTKANILSTEYGNALGTRQNTPTVNSFQTAASASSNTTSNVQIYVLGGIVAGLIVGVALATLIANRRAYRPRHRRLTPSRGSSGEL